MFSFFGGLIDGIFGLIIGLAWFVISLPVKIIGFAWSLLAGTVGFILGLALKPFLAIWLFFFPVASNELSVSTPPTNQPPSIVQVQPPKVQRTTQEIQLKPIELKVTKHETTGNLLIEQQVLVEVMLNSNSGSHFVSFKEFSLIDSDGVKYPAEFFIVNHPLIASQTIKEGEKAKGWLGFSNANCQGKCTIHFKDGFFKTYKASFR